MSKRKSAAAKQPPISLADARNPSDAIASGEARELARNTDATNERMIAEAAYYRAQQRGFAPGNEVEDWLAAEAEIGGGVLQQPEPSELH